MFSAQWGSATDVGRVRQQNEDSMFTSATIFVVADGMGGHAAGEVASRLAVAGLAGLAEADSVSVDDLATAVAGANDRILAAGQARPEQHGMGTTLTGLALVQMSDQQHWAVFNVGDSRVYRYADGLLSQLTVDHSAVQELVDAGRLDPAEARFHPRRNVVTRSMGSNPAPIPDIDVYEPVLGDRYLVCSDGLTNELLDAEIAEVLALFTEPDEAATELVRRANQAGGRDNTTVVVVDTLQLQGDTQ